MFEKIIIDLDDVADNAKVILSVRHITSVVGFNENAQFMIATAASELSTNAIRYGKDGVFSIAYVEDKGKKGVEIEVKDTGPGIEDIEIAMQENYSSSGTLGLGLPCVKRVMDEFYIDSKPGEGTNIIARKWLTH